MGRVNIAGAGLAGLSAAIHLAKAGVRRNLISQLPSERAQSVLAEGASTRPWTPWESTTPLPNTLAIP